MKVLKWLLCIVVAAWAGQYLLALMVPSLMMETIYTFGASENDYNQLVVAPVPDETSRSVVRPSPDLLYASCIYNLKGGPLSIEAPVPARYWSMQFYQMNTDNYASVTNQRGEKNRAGSRVNITLISQQDNPADYEGEVIQSPTERGIVLLRVSAIGDRTEQQAALEASSCSSI